MKTATLPSLRVEPALRMQAEHVLREGESLSSFVESAVRDGVARRLAHQEFVARGLASLEAARTTNDYVSAGECITHLRGRLEAARTGARTVAGRS